jgi:hypothetical protein
MVRSFAVALALSCLAGSAWAQAQTAPGTPATQPGMPASKPAVKKQPPKTKTTAKPPVPADNGPCQLGVIPALGDQFVVQKVGLMVFGNDRTEVPVNWGFDDLVVARVRAAAAPGTVVRRLTYAKGAFEPYYNPPTRLFRNSRDDLTAIVRQIAGNASCERYVVVVTFEGTLPGTNQILSGVGVLNHGTSLFSRTMLFTNLSVLVFDGQTFAIHKNPFATFESALARVLQPEKPNPLIELDNASFPEPAAEAANSAILRDRVRALLTAKLDKALPAYLKEEESQ